MDTTNTASIAGLLLSSGALVAALSLFIRALATYATARAEALSLKAKAQSSAIVAEAEARAKALVAEAEAKARITQADAALVAANAAASDTATQERLIVLRLAEKSMGLVSQGQGQLHNNQVTTNKQLAELNTQASRIIEQNDHAAATSDAEHTEADRQHNVNTQADATAAGV